MLELYVSPAGDDKWSGRLPEPNSDGTDGPLATVARAQKILQSMYQGATTTDARLPRDLPRLTEPSVVWLRGGVYYLDQPLRFTPDDSAPITFKAYPRESPILDGGIRVTGWKEEKLNGHTVWAASIPSEKQGVYFRQLWVNGKRAARSRFPKKGVYQVADPLFEKNPGWMQVAGNDRFKVHKKDFQNWKNLTDIELVALHYWVEERLPLESYDEATGLVVSSKQSFAPLYLAGGDDEPAVYYIENVIEALTEPGEWCLDQRANKIYYAPRQDEKLDTSDMVIPKIPRLLELAGEPERNRYVEWLSFEGITFRHTSDEFREDIARIERMKSGGVSFQKPLAGGSQAANFVPAVVHFEGARHCHFKNCAIKHAGWYAMELGQGCSNINVVANELRDLGGGGLKVGGGSAVAPRHTWTLCNQITDNTISEGGRIYHSAVGILVRHSSDNIVSHNHIHDFYYTAISIGWTWGFAPSNAYNNLVEFNDIHDIGQGVLSDMGGIYLLGVAPGTVVRNNLIRRITSRAYGGWAIYPDEGSSHLVIENNVCYDTNCSLFHQHYGRENTIRNNIFAFSDEGCAALSKASDNVSFTFANNIFVTAGKPFYLGGYDFDVETQPDAIRCDCNLFWDTEAKNEFAKNRKGEGAGKIEGKVYNESDWKTWGHDNHSILADPGFTDLNKRNFELSPDSPAFSIGFRAIDMSELGPRELA